MRMSNNNIIIRMLSLGKTTGKQHFMGTLVPQ